MLEKIVIVGGGTAGWLTANHLAKSLNLLTQKNRQVILVESPNIPTVGVGEGTVPLMRETLQYFGISETDFLVKCDATFKQSIKFIDWVNNPGTHKNNFYHHLFDYPQLYKFNSLQSWTQGKFEGQLFADIVSSQGYLCENGLAPKAITQPEYQGFAEYAYHLDAGKFSELLADNATHKLGVEHISANVLSAKLSEDGSIDSIILDRDVQLKKNSDATTEISADLFIDCSGFKGILINQLKVDFISYQNTLLVDTALAMQVPYENENEPILSHTLATAKKAGWIWDIGLTTRRGVGHVYSSQHISHDDAEKALREYVGAQADKLDCRQISMKIGHREKFWEKNCVAIGLSQGFVEPLEATGLLAFDATARILAEILPNQSEGINSAAKLFNQRVLYIWQRVIDFIKLHYYLTQRDDSDFWRDNRRLESVPDSLLEKLEIWRYRLPSQHDFFSRYETFNLDNYLYVLYGMAFETMQNAYAHSEVDSNAENQREMLSQQIRQMRTQLEPNRALLAKIKRFGLQKC